MLTVNPSQAVLSDPQLSGDGGSLDLEVSLEQTNGTLTNVWETPWYFGTGNLQDSQSYLTTLESMPVATMPTADYEAYLANPAPSSGAPTLSASPSLTTACEQERTPAAVSADPTDTSPFSQSALAFASDTAANSQSKSVTWSYIQQHEKPPAVHGYGIQSGGNFCNWGVDGRPVNHNAADAGENLPVNETFTALDGFVPGLGVPDGPPVIKYVPVAQFNAATWMDDSNTWIQYGTAASTTTGVGVSEELDYKIIPLVGGHVSFTNSSESNKPSKAGPTHGTALANYYLQPFSYQLYYIGNCEGWEGDWADHKKHYDENWTKLQWGKGQWVYDGSGGFFSNGTRPAYHPASDADPVAALNKWNNLSDQWGGTSVGPGAYFDTSHDSSTAGFGWGVSFFGIGYDSSTEWSKLLDAQWRNNSSSNFYCMYGYGAIIRRKDHADAKDAVIDYYGPQDPNNDKTSPTTQLGCHFAGQFDPPSD